MLDIHSSRKALLNSASGSTIVMITLRVKNCDEKLYHCPLCLFPSVRKQNLRKYKTISRTDAFPGRTYLLRNQNDHYTAWSWIHNTWQQSRTLTGLHKRLPICLSGQCICSFPLVMYHTTSYNMMYHNTYYISIPIDYQERTKELCVLLM